MKTRATLIAVIVLSLTVCGISATKIAARFAQLKNQLQHEAALRASVETDFAHVTAELQKTKATLNETADALESTETEKNAALASLVTQTKRADQLAEQLTKTKSALDELAAESVAIKNYDPSAFQNSMKENTELKTKLSHLQKSYARAVKRVQEQAQILGESCYSFNLPEGFNGKITAVDPKWSFFVLDVGETKGAIPDGEILINRNGKLLAKAKIRTVSENQSITNLLPGWNIGQVTEGDAFIAAR